jgi:FkbM family methyltransferase
MKELMPYGQAGSNARATTRGRAAVALPTQQSCSHAGGLRQAGWSLRRDACRQRHSVWSLRVGPCDDLTALETRRGAKTGWTRGDWSASDTGQMSPSQILVLLRRYVRALGIRRGLSAFMTMNALGSGLASVEVPELDAALSLRRGTSDGEVFRQVFLERQYDARDLPQWKAIERKYVAILARGKIPLIVDCGANIGLSTVFFQQIFPSAKIVAVEPETGNFGVLLRNCKPYPNLVPLQAAISDHGTRVRVANPGAESWAFRVEDAEEDAPESIRALTIPEIVAAYPGTELLVVKVDIEGAEEQLFRANTAWLDETPLLIVELHDWMKPFSGSSHPVLQAVASRACDLCFLGENVLVFNWKALGVEA